MIINKYDVIYLESGHDATTYICKCGDTNYRLLELTDKAYIADCVAFFATYDGNCFVEDFADDGKYYLVFYQREGECASSTYLSPKAVLKALVAEELPYELSIPILSVERILVYGEEVSFAYAPPLLDGTATRELFYERLADLVDSCWNMNDEASIIWLQRLRQGEFRHLLYAYLEMPDNVKGSEGDKMPEDFWEGKFVYIHRKKLLAALAIIAAIAVAFFTLILPKLSEREVPEFVLNELSMKEYSGKAILLREDEKSILYQGSMKDGYAEGFGLHYSADGSLLYEGGFSADMYCGQGKKYGENGVVVYVGSFLDNEYHGEGKLYDVAGALIYSGGFENGVYSGTGTLYSIEAVYSGQFADGTLSGEGTMTRNGRTVYQGGFRKNLFHGSGILYDDEGGIVYKGMFDNGQYDGEGELFGEGKLIYRGVFRQGCYHGEGEVYENDILLYKGSFDMGARTGYGTEYAGGNVSYRGGFVDGIYHGDGSLYRNGAVFYSGGFDMGIRSGNGKEFDKEGHLIYQGGFLRGLYDGEGKLYDRDTGALEFDGLFRDGKPIPKKTEEEIGAAVDNAARIKSDEEIY